MPFFRAREKAACKTPTFTSNKGPVLSSLYRDRKMRTNSFCTNFPGKFPGTSQISLLETQGRQTLEGGHELFGRHPFAWKTPTPPGGLRTQKVNLCAPFFCLTLNGPTLKTLTSLNRYSWATIAFGVIPLFLPLAITAFGGPEGYFSLAIIAFRAFQFIFPKYYQGRKKYTPPAWKPSFFSFSGSEALWCIPSFLDLWCFPFSLVFPGKWYTA